MAINQMDESTGPKGAHSTTVDKAISVIQYLAEHPEGVGVNALCRELGTQKPGLLRILNALTDAAWVIKDPHSLRYRLGYHLLTLSAQALLGPHFQEIAHEGLRQLATSTNETANLGVLDQWNIVFIDQVEAVQSIRLQVRVGSRGPVHCTALGKALTAFLPTDRLQLLWRMAPYTQFTANTLISSDDLSIELGRVRQNGFAIDDEEHRDGVRCVSAPVRNYGGDVVAALSVSGPATRIRDEVLSHVIQQVTQVAREVSAQLGHRPQTSGPD